MPYNDPSFNESAIVSSAGLVGYEIGFVDLLAVVFDAPRETQINAQPSDILPRLILPVSDFTLDITQESASEERFAGEGADPNTFLINNASFKSTAKLPLFAPVTGFIDPTFSYLWEACRTAWWGSATVAIGNLLENVSFGQKFLLVSNIADFSGLETPFNIIVDNEILTVNTVEKKFRKLSLNNPTTTTHEGDTQVVCAPTSTAYGPTTEPAFSLFSLREGLLAPCFVNKITIDATPDNSIEVSIEFVALGIYRDRQIGLRDIQLPLLKSNMLSAPKRIIKGNSIYVGPATSHVGSFNLMSPLGSPLFAGYQGLKLPPTYVNGIKIVIDNQLQFVHTLHVKNKTKQEQNYYNNWPISVYSNGRVISGELSYKAPVMPKIVCERLAGPSSINGGGLKIDFGVFFITLPELVWKPASGSGPVEDTQSHRLEWKMVSETFDAMPYLEFDTQS